MLFIVPSGSIMITMTIFLCLYSLSFPSKYDVWRKCLSFTFYLNLFIKTSVQFFNACLSQQFSFKWLQPSMHCCGCFSFPCKVPLLHLLYIQSVQLNDQTLCWELVILMFSKGVLPSNSLQSSKKRQVNNNNDPLNPFLQRALDWFPQFHLIFSKVPQKVGGVIYIL